MMPEWSDATEMSTLSNNNNVAGRQSASLSKLMAPTRRILGRSVLSVDSAPQQHLRQDYPTSSMLNDRRVEHNLHHLNNNLGVDNFSFIQDERFPSRTPSQSSISTVGLQGRLQVPTDDDTYQEHNVLDFQPNLPPQPSAEALAAAGLPAINYRTGRGDRQVRNASLNDSYVLHEEVDDVYDTVDRANTHAPDVAEDDVHIGTLAPDDENDPYAIDQDLIDGIDEAYPGAQHLRRTNDDLEMINEDGKENGLGIEGGEDERLLANDALRTQSSIPGDMGWDVFQLQERDDGTRWDKVWVTRSTQALKLVAYLVTFLFVLVGAVVTKGSLLLMVSQLRKNRVIRVCTKMANNNVARATQSTTEISMPTSVILSWVWAVNGAFVLVELLKFFHCWRKCHFRRVKRPEMFATVFVVTTEMAHCAGIGILLFRILPSLDVVRGAMVMSCVSFVPAVLKLFSRSRGEKRLALKVTLDLLAILAQATGILVWPLLDAKSANSDFVWLPFASLLMSFVWWENFVTADSSFSFVQRMAVFADRLHKSKWRIYKWLAPVRCLCMIGLSMLLSDVPVAQLFAPKLWLANLHVLATTHTASLTSAAAAVLNGITNDPLILAKLSDSALLPSGASANGTLANETNVLQVKGWLPLLVLLIHIVAALVCYQAGKFACRVCIQSFSFAFPINLATPVLVSVLIAICGLRSRDPCSLPDWWPPYLFWHCIDDSDGGNLGRSIQVGGVGAVMLSDYVWLWFLWIFSHTWITIHVWSPRCERLAKADKLFVLPLFNNILIDQDMALNRRREDGANIRSKDIPEKAGLNLEEPSPHYEEIRDTGDSPSTNANKRKHPDAITKIYACATMWHETASEMRQICKSIVRMDEDQAARRFAQKYLRVVDPDFYQFES